MQIQSMKTLITIIKVYRNHDDLEVSQNDGEYLDFG